MDATIPTLLVVSGAILAGVSSALFLTGRKTEPSFVKPSSGRTDDWSTADLEKLIAFGDSLGITDHTIPLRVWANESDNRTTAHNPNGDASGLFQLMPDSARGLGYDVDSDPHLAAYRNLSISEQLDWAGKYYAPHKGRINSVARFYVANFLPAELEHADEPNFNLTATLGGESGAVYQSNKGFDRDHKGFITPNDLVVAANIATGPRTLELIDRLHALEGTFPNV